MALYPIHCYSIFIAEETFVASFITSKSFDSEFRPWCERALKSNNPKTNVACASAKFIVAKKYVN